MNQNILSSKLLDNATEELSKLPGIGKKTALRLALHMLKRPKEEINLLGNSLIDVRDKIKKCKVCRNISDSDVCEICSNPNRDHTTICVTENIQDVIALERTEQFNGLYHVLNGLISPMDGIGPDELDIDPLIDRVRNQEISELILALSPTPEGDTTSFYIYRKVKDFVDKITTPAKGLSIGGELEYNDEITLAGAIQNRINFK
ncbi:MAG: recombination mediator RecR [Bacteroidota bacterium]|nr:recombination mediator RecR [Bacteroidota bacterium]